MTQQDLTSQFFQFDQYGLPKQGSSAFSFNFQPNVIAAQSANPNSAIGNSPSYTGFQNLSYQNSQNPTQPTQQQTQTPTPISPSSLLQQGVSTGVKNFTGIGNSITNTINSFGSSIGFSSPVTYGAEFGPSLAASGDGLAGVGAEAFGPASEAAGIGTATGITTASLGSVLGAAGLGAIGGGILAHAIGGNTTGGSIGGAVGAGAGMAFGAAGAAALGMELGAFAGPVGAIGGGIGGAIFGSMFGNTTKPTSADNYGGNLTETGGISNPGGGSKNAGQYANFGKTGVNSFSQLAQAASASLGIKYDPNVNVNVGISTQHGGAYFSVGDTKIPFTAGNADSQHSAQLQALTLAAQQSGYSDTTALNDFYKKYTTGTLTQAAQPTIPHNPGPTGNQKWADFLTNYKASQDANAA